VWRFAEALACKADYRFGREDEQKFVTRSASAATSGR
jgi:hypothetical protein